MNDIIYIATDRAYAGRFRLYGGHGVYPNLSRMADSGTLYSNATATAGSTLMCHASEWTGRYTWELHSGLPHKKRVYQKRIPFQDSIFTDLLKKEYDIYVVLVKKRPAKCYDSFSPVFDLWPKDLKIRLVDDWDRPGARENTRRTQFEEILNCLEESKKNGRRAFVWVKCHGFYQWEQRIKYLKYSGQRRVTKEDVYNSEIDDNIGYLLDSIDYKKDDSPEVWFASDHGSFAGEHLRSYYGYHLDQEIVHVPLIRSKGPGGVVGSVFSMKEIRRMLNGDTPNLSEKLIYAETLYPGQFADGPSKGVHSMPKIMVRMGRYKYIYSRYGINGDSETPEEEMYDLAYDPREKFNMAMVFSEKYYDIARPDRSGEPLGHILSRIHSNDDYAKGINKIDFSKYDKSLFKDALNESGWVEMYDVFRKLRRHAGDIWRKTDRGSKYVL